MNARLVTIFAVLITVQSFLVSPAQAGIGDFFKPKPKPLAIDCKSALTTGVTGKMTLDEMLKTNGWATPYKSSLEELGSGIYWVQVSDIQVVGKGLINPQIGEVEVNIINGLIGIQGAGIDNIPVDFFIEFYIKQGLFNSGDSLIMEFPKRYRSLVGLSEDIKFINVIGSQPISSGDYKGYHRGIILPTVYVQYEGGRPNIQRFLVTQVPQTRPIVQGLVKSFVQTATDFPVRSDTEN